MHGDTWQPLPTPESSSSATESPSSSPPPPPPPPPPASSLALILNFPKLRCVPLKRTMSSNSNLETRTLFDELKSLEKGWVFDFGHPLVNRVAESFVKAAGIGAIQAVSREAYFTSVEGAGIDSSSTVPELSKRHRFPGLRGENSKKSLEEMVKSTGKESFQWGLAAGVYSGLTYGIKEARGSHDWKNSALAGAITGAALALTREDTTHEQIMQCAITGAAISTAANLPVESSSP